MILSPCWPHATPAQPHWNLEPGPMARCKTKRMGNPKGQGGNKPPQERKTWWTGCRRALPTSRLCADNFRSQGTNHEPIQRSGALGRWSARYRELARAGGVVRVPLFLPGAARAASVCASHILNNLVVRNLTIPCHCRRTCPCSRIANRLRHGRRAPFRSCAAVMRRRTRSVRARSTSHTSSSSR